MHHKEFAYVSILWLFFHVCMYTFLLSFLYKTMLHLNLIVCIVCSYSKCIQSDCNHYFYNQMTVCYMKGVNHSGELTENYWSVLFFPSTELYSVCQSAPNELLFCIDWICGRLSANKFISMWRGVLCLQLPLHATTVQNFCGL